ncbi:hypothetical protein WS96_18165 [Burkholderia sp. MSMB1835]|nr:hypothetical protein WS96_18165 [Burkholderia sp. MSMB1835]
MPFLSPSRMAMRATHAAPRDAGCVFGRIVGDNACARIDPARRPCRCAARIAIQSHSRRGEP